MANSQPPDPEKAIGLDDAYSVITPDDNRRLYSKWADTYETSFVAATRYRYPRAVAEHFANQVPASVGEHIVDVGCGTGIVGTRLAQLRPTCRIDGIDISPEMLAQAKNKRRHDSSPVYDTLFEADLTKPIAEIKHEYHAMLSAGTFTHGHLGPEVIALLLSLVRVEGWIVIGINAEHFESRGFAEILVKTTRAGLITSPDLHKIQVYERGSPHFGDQAVVATFRRIN